MEKENSKHLKHFVIFNTFFRICIFKYALRIVRTLCGTPNYIAPEILTKAGHSYEVDIWSIGCIMYTLLVGKPPFETSSLKETYAKIKLVDYKKPSHMQNTAAMNMISNMLQGSPSKRPSVAKLLKDPFFTSGK
jgi:polo-like kinase 1